MSLSTHVLDTARGGPAAGVPVTLSRLDGETWTVLSTRETDDDGRVPGLLPETSAATYRLRFDTAPWFAAQGIVGFYPWAEVVFTVTAPDEHYHVPLLLSPFGYSTYRGS